MIVAVMAALIEAAAATETMTLRMIIPSLVIRLNSAENISAVRYIQHAPGDISYAMFKTAN